MMDRLALNGRFLKRPVTGVERLASELFRAVETIAAEEGWSERLSIAVPPGNAERGDYALLRTPREVTGHLPGQPWEQLDLLTYRRAATLLSFCNLGPVLRRRQALIICDAQIYQTPHSYSRAFRTWYQLVLPLLGRSVRTLLTISEYSRRELERYGVAPPGKTRVIRLGVDHMARIEADDLVLERHGLVRGRFVLAIGSLAPHKNLRTLILAFAEAALSGVELVIAGGYNARVFGDAGLPTPPGVRFVGRVTDEELKGLYAGALAFACPSVTEGFGLTPLEAMASGTAVVATTGGAVPEVCGEAAIYADPHSIAEWRDALRYIAGAEERRTEWRGKALAHSAGFRWRKGARDVLAAIHHAQPAPSRA